MSPFYYMLPFLAFVISLVVTRLAFSLPNNFIALDKPNARSLHDKPTPRIGGVAILIGIILPLLLYKSTDNSGAEYLPIFFAFMTIAGISLIDDFYSIGFLIRIIIHTIAAIIVINSGYLIESITAMWGQVAIPFYIASVMSIIFIVWMTNLYNFMDGIDGLAGGMAISGFGTFAVIGFIEGQLFFAVTALVVASSSLGFLVWNYPPAKIFMGDSGSSSLGFLAAVLSIWAHMNEIIPIWISVVIFSPFIVDATVTLIIRIIKRERFWAAHKTHHYQLLADSGMDRRKLVNYEYVLMLVCAVIAVISYDAGPDVQALFILMLGILYIVLMRYARKAGRKIDQPES